MAYKIVIANQKGGVAKTTTAVNIADALKYMGYRVLLLDLDPQCNSTSVFVGGAVPEEEKTILDVFLKKASISDCIKHTDFGDVVCGSRELANSEDTFMRAAGGLKIVKNALKEINEDYDYIIMDTPPNCGAFMRNALFAANGIITPLQAKRFALDGLTDFLDTIELLKDDGNEQLEILGLLLTMYDQRNKQDKEIIAALPEVGEKLNINVFKTPIRINQAIENAIADSKSLFLTRSTSNGANDYADLVCEILDIINKGALNNECA